MSRNVTIIVIILIVVLLAAYLVWLRGRFVATQTPNSTPEVVVASPTLEPTPTPSATATASPSATPKVSPSARPKTPSPKPSAS